MTRATRRDSFSKVGAAADGGDRGADGGESAALEGEVSERMAVSVGVKLCIHTVLRVTRLRKRASPVGKEMTIVRAGDMFEWYASGRCSQTS
jgi:hypothetical protein